MADYTCMIDGAGSDAARQAQRHTGVHRKLCFKIAFTTASSDTRNEVRGPSNTRPMDNAD